jgi:hypothetical protein
MGQSPAAIAAAGDNAAAEVLAAARTAREGAGTPEGARQGHLAAVALRDANLARNLSFGVYTGMNLTTEYRHAQRAMDAFARLPPAPDAPRLNLAYLSADPYLVHHNVDIDALIAEPITPGEFARMRAVLVAAMPAAGPAVALASPTDALDVVNGYVTGPEVRMAALKRIKRLFDEAQRKLDVGEGPVQDFSGVLPGVTMTPMMELAYDLGENSGRCIDGVQRTPKSCTWANSSARWSRTTRCSSSNGMPSSIRPMRNSRPWSSRTCGRRCSFPWGFAGVSPPSTTSDWRAPTGPRWMRKSSCGGSWPAKATCAWVPGPPRWTSPPTMRTSSSR